MSPYNIGDEVLVKWNDGKEYLGKVVKPLPRHVLPSGAFRVHYKGWNTKYDEDVYADLMRPAGDVNANRPIKSVSKKTSKNPKNDKKSENSKKPEKSKSLKGSKSLKINKIISKTDSKSKTTKTSPRPTTPPTPHVPKKPRDLFGSTKVSPKNLKRKNKDSMNEFSKAKKQKKSPKGRKKKDMTIFSSDDINEKIQKMIDDSLASIEEKLASCNEKQERLVRKLEKIKTELIEDLNSRLHSQALSCAQRICNKAVNRQNGILEETQNLTQLDIKVERVDSEDNEEVTDFTDFLSS